MITEQSISPFCIVPLCKAPEIAANKFDHYSLYNFQPARKQKEIHFERNIGRTYFRLHVFTFFLRPVGDECYFTPTRSKSS